MALVEVAKEGIGSVQNGRAYVDTLANKFIVRPKTVQGIGGFLFDYEGDATIQLQADITDHYNEANQAVQDHVALRPTRITLRGFVAELVQKAPVGLVGALQQIQNRLTTVPAYLGKYTPGGLKTVQAALTKTQSVVSQIDQGLARIKNIVGFFDKTTQGRTKQQQAYNKLQTLMVTKQVMFVETPWGVHNNMVIDSLVLVQEEKTKMWSDITVTLKQLRFVSVSSATIDARSGRNALQAAAKSDKGSTNGTPVPVSIAYRLTGGFQTGNVPKGTIPSGG